MKHVIYRAEMEGISIDRSTRDTKFNMGNKHWHKDCEIQYIIEGTRWLFVDDQTFRVEQGGLFLVDSEQIHCTMSDREFYHDRILLLVEKDKFADACQALGFDLYQFFEKHRGVIQVQPENQKYVEKLLTDIAEEINRREEGYEILVQARMMELWLFILRFKYNGAQHKEDAEAGIWKNQLVYQVMDYIKNHYNESKSLGDISNKFYVDKCYLSRIFKSITGFTVNEYINIQRIRQAQRLLEDTDHSIAEIAEMAGYENATYFSRIFRKYIESTPMQYRKKRKAYKQSVREKSGL